MRGLVDMLYTVDTLYRVTDGVAVRPAHPGRDSVTTDLTLPTSTGRRSSRRSRQDSAVTCLSADYAWTDRAPHPAPRRGWLRQDALAKVYARP